MNEIKPFARQGHYTVFDNALIDELMPRLSFPAWKVLCVILRKTIGHSDRKGGRKQEDAISYSQLRAGSGIKHDLTVQRAIAELAAEGVIIVISRGRRKTTVYRINRDYTLPGQSSSSSEEASSSSSDEERAQSSSSGEDTKQSSKQTKRQGAPSSSFTEDFPEELDTAAFRELWEEWEKHLKDSGKKITPSTIGAQLRECAEHGADAASTLIQEAIAKGYKALYWERLEQKKSSDGDRRDALWARVEAYSESRITWADCDEPTQKMLRAMYPYGPEDAKRSTPEALRIRFFQTCKELGI